MVSDLREYNQKRNFDLTFEPEGEIKSSDEGLRFAVQHHLARKEHFDLRLEWDGVLLSWAIPKGPSYDTRDKRLAVKVEDHPYEYRNFEGSIPGGEYGGGVVMLWDEGFWEPYGDTDEGIRKGELKFTLKGRRLKGNWALIRWKAKSGETRDNWLLLKEKDGFAQDAAGISQFTTSIRTGRTMAEIERGEDEKSVKNPFDSTDVQLAKLVSKIPEGGNWVYELKYDGYRIIAYIESNTVRLVTRNGKDYTRRFRDIADSLMDLAAGRAMVLDGEIAVIDASGKTNFHGLQSYIKSSELQNLTYIIFDILALEGTDLRGESLIDRKEKLEILMVNPPVTLYYGRYVKGQGKDSFAAACEAGMEGIVGKKADSVYSGTRNGDWIKLKCDNRQEFVIGGYSISDKRSTGISSLLLGVYEGGILMYAGRAGTGISEADMKMLKDKFSDLERTVSPFGAPPFENPPGPGPGEKITWLEPRLVAEIKFAEWTENNLLRQASFKGLRTDKAPGDISREKVADKGENKAGDKAGNKAGNIIEDEGGTAVNSDGAAKPEGYAGDIAKPPIQGEQSGGALIIEGVRITNPNKLVFEEPAITKADVVRYYAAAAERMLPYVQGRILSIVRCPRGILQTCFFKKHPGLGSKGIVTMDVSNSEGGYEKYFYIENTFGLINEAQMGTLEFHTWGSRADTVEKPDMMVFDLDPDEGMELDIVRRGVRDLRSILAELSLNTYIKTSGGKGYHIVVPLMPAASWEVFHDFARRVAEVMENKWPDRYTSNVRKAQRKDKIFIDWIRNARGATSIAPYSLRARKGAVVSMPIGWEELDAVAPGSIDMAEAIRRIAGKDPWEGFFNNGQKLR